MNNSFQIVKTSKNIDQISDKISDRLIITKSGEMYFDYSNNERIPISTLTTTYNYESLFSGKVGEYQTILFSDLKLYDKNGNKYSVLKPNKNSLIFDINGSYGIIIYVDDNYCNIVILGIVDKNVLTNLSLGNSLIKNIVVAKEVNDIKITKSILNPETNETKEENINIKSNDKVIKFDVKNSDNSNTDIKVSINVSKMSDNIIKILDDGLYVSETGTVNKYIHYDVNYKLPSDIPKPYLEANLYLISPNENYYELYVAISETDLIQIGNSGLEIYRI